MAFRALCHPIACQHTSAHVRRALRVPAPAIRRSCRASRPSPARFHHPRTQLRTSVIAGAEVEDRINELTDEIKIFETERDEATKTAETLAKTSVKLLDMVELLDKLALEKVSEGDEEAARNILKEKEEVKLMMDKTNTRAQNNFALAAKLAEAIGQKQTVLVSLLPSGSQPVEEPASLPPSDLYTPPASPLFSSDRPFNTVPKWQASLEQAKERLRQAEKDASMQVRLAQYGAEDNIAAALARIHERQQDIMVHRERLRASAEQSILEAKERLKQQEEEALEEIKWLMRRYRSGEYIPDYQLDSAFDKLSRRMYR